MDLPFIAEMYKGGNEQGAIHYDYEGNSYINVSIPRYRISVGKLPPSMMKKILTLRQITYETR